MDEVHLARSIMPQEVFCNPLLPPLQTSHHGLLPKHVWFVWSMITFPLQLRWLSPT